MHIQRPSRIQQITASVLVGTGVMLVARPLVVGCMGLLVWLVGNLLWLSQVPDELRFQPVWFMSQITSPYHWLVYLACGAIAGGTAWLYQTAADKRQQRMLWLCFATLLVLTGWFMMPLELLMVLTGMQPMYPHGWRVIVQGLFVMTVEPACTAIALLRMPAWMRLLHQPVATFLQGG